MKRKGVLTLVQEFGGCRHREAPPLPATAALPPEAVTGTSVGLLRARFGSTHTKIRD